MKKAWNASGEKDLRHAFVISSFWFHFWDVHARSPFIKVIVWLWGDQDREINYITSILMLMAEFYEKNEF